MAKIEKEEQEAISEFLTEKIFEIGDFLELHHVTNSTVNKLLAFSIAYISNPPLGTWELYADAFRDNLLKALAVIHEMKTDGESKKESN